MENACERPQTVAIIGSFKQFYNEVLKAVSVFQNAGIQVQSPIGTNILKQGIDFVRFNTDPPIWRDSMVQTVALHRILRADFTFVVSPKGYVGRTTCYEIGRVIQCGRPIFFSEHPVDLPLDLRDGQVQSADELVRLIDQGKFTGSHPSGSFERILEAELLDKRYRQEHEFESEELQ